MSGSNWQTLASVAVDSCWALVGAVWLAGGLYNRAHAPRIERRAGAGLGLAGVVAAWLALRLVPHGDWSSLELGSWPLRAPGVLLLLCSTAFTLWARVVLGTMWSSMAATRGAAHELRTSGPYAVTRHPIYTGLLGMLLGTCLASGLGRWTVLFGLALVAVEAKIRAEERLLSELFGGDYRRYRERVPQLVPGLRLRRTI